MQNELVVLADVGAGEAPTGEGGGSSSVLAFFDVLASDEALLGDRATLFLAPTGVASESGLLATSASSWSASLTSAGAGDAFAKNDEIALMPVTGGAAFFGGISPIDLPPKPPFQKN